MVQDTNKNFKYNEMKTNYISER